jgi:hypothetical protein
MQEVLNMDAEILRIIDFEERILSECKTGEGRFNELKSKLNNCCENDSYPYAILLLSFLKNAVKETGVLPSFFDELPFGIRRILDEKKERINTHDCVNCSLKHVSSAAVIINEILNGYENTDHEIFLMGNLNEACEQIAETSLELSNELRNLRVDIFEKERKVTQPHLRRIKDIYREIRQLSDTNIKMQKTNNHIQKTPKKPCGCSKNNPKAESQKPKD